MRQKSNNARREVKHEVREVAQIIFNIVPEDPKDPHIPDDVKPGSVQKHGRQDGNEGADWVEMTRSEIESKALWRHPELPHEGVELA